MKELRAAAGVTQEELAERADLFRTYMSRIEGGLANPTLTVLVALAAALEVPIAALFDGASGKASGRVKSSSQPSRGRVR